MKIELCPEDMLLEYVENRLNGRFDVQVKNEQYLKHLPPNIEFSEEFALKCDRIIKMSDGTIIN